MPKDAPPANRSLIPKRIKWLLAAGVGVLLAVLVYQAGWGRLMPFLPWTPGFDRVERSRAVVLHHPDTRGVAGGVAAALDDLVGQVESFHGLTFRLRPEVLLTSSEAEYRRLSGGSARFRALPVRGRVFVSPRAVSQSERREIHLDTYLRHELSHALLFQHLGWSGMLGLPPWFEEGLATASADQMGVDGYFDREHVIAWWRLGRAVPPSQYRSHWEDSDATMSLPDGERFLFLFAQYALLIDDLIARQGRPKLQDLLDRLLRGEEMAEAFQVTYGTSPDSYFAELVTRSTSSP